MNRAILKSIMILKSTMRSSSDYFPTKNNSVHALICVNKLCQLPIGKLCRQCPATLLRLITEQNRTEHNFISLKLYGTIHEELNTNQSKT